MATGDSAPNRVRPSDELEAERVKAAVLGRLLPGSEVSSPKIGRFVVLRQVGHGGMGVVYAVYDEQLDRRVALKLIKGDASPELRARLQREARALAKLSHPNVVPVFEVGEHAGEAYIVMEYVRGETLRQWLTKAEHSAKEILDKYIQAGEGLAAAHATGLVHRDFKPENAIVGESGRVRVLDFGLARKHIDGEEITIAETVLPTPKDDAFATPLTATGSMMGTPVYMAPEQFLGEAVDHRTDQFAFCIALWEALCGERPFAGKTKAELVANVTAGKLRDPTKLPARVRSALARGLSVSPEDRFASMPELLASLRPPRRSPWPWAAGLVAVGIGSGLFAWSADRAKRCTGAERQLAQVWDDARRARVQEAMLGTKAAYAHKAWENTTRDLDAYAARWKDMYTEACAATTIRGEQSIEVMDLRMACLRRSKLDLDAAAGVLATADADVVAKAHEVVAKLRPLDRCGDVDALQANVDPPRADEADAVEEARSRLAEARAQRNAGRYAIAHEKIEAAEHALDGVEYGPVQSELLCTKGDTLALVGRYEAAAAALERALESAAKWNQRELMAHTATSLLYVVGYRQGKPSEGLRYLAAARGLATGDANAEASVSNNLAVVFRAQGKYEEAELEHRRALALWEQALGPESQNAMVARNNLAIVLYQRGELEEAEALHRRTLTLREGSLGVEHPDVAQSRHNLGLVLRERGEYAEAEAEHRRAVTLWTEALGPDHPLVATAQQGVAVTLSEEGRYREAEQEQRRVLALRTRLFGPDHPSVSESRSNLAFILTNRGDYEGAEAEFRRAIATWEKTLGLEHPEVATARNGLAIVLAAQGKHGEAVAGFRRVLDLWARDLGADHPRVAAARNNLGTALAEQGKLDEAETELRGALASWEAALGSDHLDVARARTGLARLLVERDRADEALEYAEQAWAVRRRDDAPADERAETAFVLARALWEAGAHMDRRERARDLAEAARELYRESEGATDDMREVDTWLQNHRPGGGR